MVSLPPPQWSNVPTTAFLTLLVQQGFTGWFSFDTARDNSAMWKAIAAMLIWHSEIKYPEVHNFLTGQWKPIIQTIVNENQRYTTLLGSNKLGSTEYWGSIGTACMSLAVQYFTGQNKASQADLIAKGGCPGPENRQAYEKLAARFFMCLSWYEAKSDGSVVSHIFHNTARGELCLFIHIAKEADRLYLLFHEKLNESPVIDFPFAMKVTMKGKPLEIGAKLQVAAPATDPTEALITGLLRVVENSAVLTLAVCGNEIPVSAAEYKRTFAESVNVVKALIDSTRQPFNVMSDPLSRLLSLPVSQQPVVQLREPHTVVTCELYPELGDLMDFHSHKFHRACLSGYLGQLQLRYPNRPRCPLCTQDLPDCALDVSPSVREYYEANRQARTTHQVAGPNAMMQPLFSHFTLPAQHSTLTCVVCQNTYSRTYFIAHNCQVCLRCSAKAQEEQGRCAICGNYFRQDELEAMGYTFPRQ